MTLTESEREEIIKKSEDRYQEREDVFMSGSFKDSRKSAYKEAIRLTEEKIEEQERQKRKEICKIVLECSHSIPTFDADYVVKELKEKGYWIE